MGFKEVVIKAIKIYIAILIIALTIRGAMAFELDSNEDHFTLSPGDEIKGFFVINPGEEITLSTDSEFITFERGQNKRFKDHTNGVHLAEDAYYHEYWVVIPEDSDYGIYRTTIKIEGSTTRYLNVRMDIWGEFRASILSKFYNSSLLLKIIIGISLLAFIIIIARVVFF